MNRAITDKMKILSLNIISLHNGKYTNVMPKFNHSFQVLYTQDQACKILLQIHCVWLIMCDRSNSSSQSTSRARAPESVIRRWRKSEPDGRHQGGSHPTFLLPIHQILSNISSVNNKKLMLTVPMSRFLTGQGDN